MKEILAFLIGLVVGFGCSIVFFVAANIDSERSDSVNKSLKSLSKGLMQEKGAIMYPKTDEMIAMEETFEANDRANRDTEIGEIEGDGM